MHHIEIKNTKIGLNPITDMNKTHIFFLVLL